MDERSSAVVITRKRGHQHHPRQSGTRRSNVPAVEVIAALRGETVPYHHPLTDDQSLDVDNNNVVIVAQTIRSEAEPAYTPVLSTIDINSRRDLHDIVGGSAISNASPSPPPHNDNNNCDTNVPKQQQQQQLDNAINYDVVDVLSNVIIANDIDGSSPIDVPIKKIRKSKPKPSQDPLNPTAGSRTKPTELKRRKKQLNTPREERPPLEGAAATDEPDIENDPEAAEWLKLRCTSERTEVVAEREYRRQNRRCADYPGLAFGRSIFSSDTMMKFNIIRNELHNIMNTQLKRVGYVDGETVLV